MLKTSQLRRVIDVLHPGLAYPNEPRPMFTARVPQKPAPREAKRTRKGVEWDSDTVSLDSIEFKRHETISRFESRDPDEPREPKRLRAGRELPF